MHNTKPTDKLLSYILVHQHLPHRVQILHNTDLQYDHTTHIWNYNEMAGDHIVPWSKAGKTERGNLQMLCKHHNSLKSNY